MKAFFGLLGALFLLTGCALVAELQGVSSEAIEAPTDNQISSDTRLMERMKEITQEVAPGGRGIVVRLQGLVFKTGASSLTPGARIQLRDISKLLIEKEFTNRLVAVEGHTDAIGEELRNLSLSKRRAAVVAGELTLNKLPSARIVVRGYGERFPLEFNDSDKDSGNPSRRAKNRRVELIIGHPFTEIQERSH